MSRMSRTEAARGTLREAALAETDSFRVLVIEDSETVAGMFKELLKEEFSAEVTVATNCEEARDALSGGTFDIVTLDYRLPDGHGHELLMEITMEDDHPPVIMVTGHGDEEIAALSLRLGASGYVVKDRGLNTMLIDAVNNALDEIALSAAESDLRESEERYRLLVEGSLFGIMVHDGFNILYVNDSAARISGYPRDHFENIKDVLDLLDPSEREKVVNYMRRRLAGEDVPEIYETSITREDGTRADVQLANAMADSGGRPIVMVTIVDITAQKTAQRRLEEEKAFLDAALDAINDIFCVFDLEGGLARYNRALLDRTGYSEEELSDRKMDELFMGGDFNTDSGELVRLLRAGNTVFFTSLIPKEGKDLPYELTVSLLEAPDGNDIAFCIVARDVSGREGAR